jgi:hypothetical protein
MRVKLLNLKNNTSLAGILATRAMQRIQPTAGLHLLLAT